MSFLASEGIARKSSVIALTWTRTLSCISAAYNGHNQPFACPRCTTSPMWLACDTSTRSSLSAVPPAPLRARSPHKAHSSKQPSMMRMPTPLRTGLCVERFLASLFRCSLASAKSEGAIQFSLAVINRTNVPKFCLQLRPLQRGLLLWSFHLLPGSMLRLAAVIPSATSCCNFHVRPSRFVFIIQGSYLPSTRHRVAAHTLSFNSKLQFQLRFFDITTLGVFHHT